MSSFTALNITLDDVVEETEDHSIEFQIEESFKIFQQALFHLKAKQFEEAGLKFGQLFEIDVLKPDKWNIYRYTSPTLETLRYLAYRNRGVFYYQYVKDNYESMDKEDIVDYILKSLENLVESLQHSDGDSTVTELLTYIFRSFKSKRLERWVLEYELIKTPEEIYLLKRGKSPLTHTKKTILRYKELLADIYDKTNGSTAMKLIELIHDFDIKLLDKEPALVKIENMKLEDEKNMKKLDKVELVLEEVSWEAIAESLREMLPKYKNNNFFGKIPDPYSEVSEPIECINFVKKTVTFDLDIDENVNIEQQIETCSISDIQISGTQNRSETTKLDKVFLPEIHKKSDSSGTVDQKPIQRSSKRFKERGSEFDETEILVPHMNFIAELNCCCEQIGSEPILNILELSPDQIPQDSSYYMAMCDLYDCLSCWTNRHTEFLSQGHSKIMTRNGSEKEEYVHLASLLKANIASDENLPTQSLTDLPPEHVQMFINTCNSRKFHYQAVRFYLLYELLKTDINGLCLITDTFWSPLLFNTIESFVLSLETNLFNVVYENKTKYSGLALSIFEILVNTSSSICTDITTKKLSGQKINDLETHKNKLEKKIFRWSWILKRVSLNEKSKLRFMWANFCFIQCNKDITDKELIYTLEEIHGKFGQTSLTIEVAYANYKHIPRLDKKSVQSQLSKICMIMKFTTMENKDENFDNGTISSQEQVDSLAWVLNDKSPRTHEEKSIFDFIQQSPILIKLKLWKIVLDYYFSKKKQNDFKMCYFKVVSLLYDRLCSQDYKDQSQLQRQQTLLTTISCIGSFTSNYMLLLSNNNLWSNIDFESSVDELLVLLDILRLTYPLVFYETMTQKNTSLKSFFQKALKSSTVLKDIFTNILCLTIIYLRGIFLTKSPENSDLCIINLVWYSHLLLGHFKFCDSSSSIFLKYAEMILCKSKSDLSIIQLKQLLWCRYHLSVGGDSTNIEHHDTEVQVMERESALSITQYLIRLQYNGGIIDSSNSKMNLKPILDNVIDVIGEINYKDNHIMARNEYFFDQYLLSSLKINTICCALNGKLKLEFTRPNDELQYVADLGLFYLSGFQAMNLYKSRKKSMQARPSELDYIISILKSDIIYDTRRPKSWFLLGRCFSFMVEDDLIWTSDKLTTIEKKRATSVTQRKAILCYLMSASLFISKSHELFTQLSEKEEEISVFKDVLEVLAEEMINGHWSPMNDLCYQLVSNPGILLEDGCLKEKSTNESQSISKHNIEQVIQIILRNADNLYITGLKSKRIPRNWKNVYYMSKLKFKMSYEEFKNDGFNLALISCNLAQNNSHPSDMILEPHYFLISACYKSVKNKWITINEALEILYKNNEFFQQPTELFSINKDHLVETEGTQSHEQIFYQRLIVLLRKILSSDKKKWHHRPKYRIARILFDEMKNLNGALEEMNNLMALKSVNKNLVNIWKPDTERPGKHFVYTYQYVKFYLTLLNCKNDFVAIGYMIKKLRRYGAGMIKTYEAIDESTSKFCTVTRNILQLNEKDLTENILPSLNYQSFVKISQELFKSFKKENYDSQVREALVISYQLKKGVSAIAFDGICLTIYFKYFYLPFVEAYSDESVQSSSKTVKMSQSDNTALQSEVPNGKSSGKFPSSRKRVSKKDAFDKIAQLVDKRIM